MLVYNVYASNTIHLRYFIRFRESILFRKENETTPRLLNSIKITYFMIIFIAKNRTSRILIYLGLYQKYINRRSFSFLLCPSDTGTQSSIIEVTRCFNSAQTEPLSTFRLLLTWKTLILIIGSISFNGENALGNYHLDSLSYTYHQLPSFLLNFPASNESITRKDQYPNANNANTVQSRNYFTWKYLFSMKFYWKN